MSLMSVRSYVVCKAVIFYYYFFFCLLTELSWRRIFNISMIFNTFLRYSFFFTVKERSSKVLLWYMITLGFTFSGKLHISKDIEVHNLKRWNHASSLLKWIHATYVSEAFLDDDKEWFLVWFISIYFITIYIVIYNI